MVILNALKGMDTMSMRPHTQEPDPHCQRRLYKRNK